MSLDTQHIQNFTAYGTRTAGGRGSTSRMAQISENTAQESDFKNNVAAEMATDTRANTGFEASAPSHTAGRTIGSTPSQGANSAERTAGISQYSEATKGDWSFWDFLDVINPLQHIPVLNTVYRSLTGDEINNTARILGGTLYGGVPGAAISIANAAVDEATGKDFGEHAVAMAFGQTTADETPDMGSDILLASNDQPPPQQGKISEEDIIWNTMPPSSTSSLTFALSEIESSAPAHTPSLTHPLSQDAELSPPPYPSSFTDVNGTPTQPERSLSVEGQSQTIYSTPTPSSYGSSLETKTEQRTPPGHSAESLASQGAGQRRFPHSQNARAFGAEESVLSPELIAQEMMQALDQYGDMKRQDGLL